MKLISSYTSYWQFQTLRSLGNMMICIMLAVVSGHLMLLRPVNTGAVYLRATFLSTTMFCFFSGAPFLSIAQMAAGLYTYPVFVTILATPILGEKVGVWRATAVLIGAIGAAIASPMDRRLFIHSAFAVSRGVLLRLQHSHAKTFLPRGEPARTRFCRGSDDGLEWSRRCDLLVTQSAQYRNSVELLIHRDWMA